MARSNAHASVDEGAVFGCWGIPGYDADQDLCVGSARYVTKPDGTPADFRTYTGNHPSRGVQIQAWLDERGYQGRLRETARIFAVALRDHGFFITDTAGSATFAVSGSANPATATKWRALGIEGSGFDLLFGLLTKERLWIVQPATNHCEGGTLSHYGCPAAHSGY